MTKRVKLALLLRGYDPSGLAVFANTILMAMTGNVNFPNASPYLQKLTLAITDLQTAITAPIPNVLLIKSKVAFIEKILMALKTQVELECNDDEVIAVSSGFALRQNTTVKPKVFDASQGTQSGTVNLVAPYAGRNAAYIWEIIADPINLNTWQQLRVTNTTGTTATNLVAGNKYWFRVKAIVNDEEQASTDPHMVHVV